MTRPGAEEMREGGTERIREARKIRMWRWSCWRGERRRKEGREGRTVAYLAILLLSIYTYIYVCVCVCVCGLCGLCGCVCVCVCLFVIILNVMTLSPPPTPTPTTIAIILIIALITLIQVGRHGGSSGLGELGTSLWLPERGEGGRERGRKNKDGKIPKQPEDSYS